MKYKHLTNFLVISALMLGVLACAKKKSAKVNSNSTVKSELNVLREKFANEILLPMKDEIESVSNSYNNFKILKASVQNFKGQDVKTLKSLTSNFLHNYGQSANATQEQINQLKEKLSTLKVSIRTLQKTKNKIYNIFKNQQPHYTECRRRIVKTQKKYKDIAIKIKNTIEQLQKKQQSFITKSKTELALGDKYIVRGRFDLLEKYFKHEYASKKIVKKAQALTPLITKAYIDGVNRLKWINHAFLNQVRTCKPLAKNTFRIANRFTKYNSKIKSQLEAILNIQTRYNKIITNNAILFSHFDTYKINREILTGNIQKKIDRSGRDYIALNDALIKKFGIRYKNLYITLLEWIHEPSVDGRYSLQIIDHINKENSSSKKLVEIKERLIQILKVASKTKITFLKFSGNRKFASLISDLTGIDINLGQTAASIVKGGVKGIKALGVTLNKTANNLKKEITKKIKKIGSIGKNTLTIDLPKLPSIKISKLNLSKMPRFKEFKIPNSLSNLELKHFNSKFKLAEFEQLLPQINLQSIEINIPNIEILYINTDVNDEINNSFEKIRSTTITIPKVEIIRIEADLAADLRSPGNFFNNLKKHKDDLDREFTIGKNNIDRIFTKSYHDTKRETDKGIHKTGVALAAVGQPENLARIALVYTASVYGGPMGSALANAVLDKYIYKKDMTEQDMLNSFVIGAAAGYAGEAAVGASEGIYILESMPAATSAIASNLTSDLGNVAIKGEDYTFDDFVSSVAKGATTIDMGDGFAAEVFESAINSGKDYSIDQVVHHKKIDMDALSDHIYNGIANGVTKHAVNKFVDDFIVKNLPKEYKRSDKTFLKKLKEDLYRIFVAAQEVERKNQLDTFSKEFSKLSDQEKQEVSEALQNEGQRISDRAAQKLYGKNFNELSIEEATSDEFSENLQFEAEASDLFNSEKIEEIKELFGDPEKITKEGRNVAFAKHILKASLIAMSMYGTYRSIEDAKELKQKINAGALEGKSMVDVLLENKLDTALLGADVIMAVVPALKAAANSPMLINRVLKYAKEFDIKSAEGIEELAKMLKAVRGGKYGDIRKVDEFVGSVRKLGIKTKEGIAKLAKIKQSKNVTKGLNGAAKHDLYKKQLRNSMAKPNVKDSKLSKVIDRHYRPNAKVGSGSTADAVRAETLTGKPTGSRWHSEKARNDVQFLKRWLGNNPKAASTDKAAAEQVMLDLMEALGDI